MTPEQFDELVDPTREQIIALLTRDGQDDNLACFSPWGQTTKECAEVAALLAWYFAETYAEPMSALGVNEVMARVVNAADGELDGLIEMAEYEAMDKNRPGIVGQA
jgi:hypothetical protein